MSQRTDNEGHKGNEDRTEKRMFTLPSTSSKPPMPPVKPPKKN